MLNKLIIVFLLLTTVTLGQTFDGYYWMDMTEIERINYLYGAANENFILLSQLIQDGLLNENTVAPYIIAGESYEIVMDEITAFYENTQLYNYAIGFVIHIRNNWKYTDPSQSS
jgi:hypothetical protein